MEVSPSLRLLVLGGDHMLGRAIQLTLPHRTRLEESLMDSMPAWYYLQLGLRDALPSLPSIREANRTGGYLYRHLMPLCTALEPDVTLFNVETSITTCLDHEDAPPKAIHYHTQPDNLFGLVDNLTPSPLVVSCANNHHSQDTPRHFAGLGKNIEAAATLANIQVGDVVVQVFAVAACCAGASPQMQATTDRSGVVLLPALSSTAAVTAALSILRAAIERAKEPADDGQVFRRHVAHELIDAGLVDCIYGHWSHHLRGVEIYKGKCILYDAGDLVNDYESFTNPGEDCYLKIGAVFAVDVATDSRRVVQITVIPMYMEQLQLVRLGSGSQQWQPRSKCIESAPSLEQVREFLTEMSLLDCQESLPWRRVWAVEGPALLYP
ncbi:hypothetical protein Ae201684P_006233 [Aphanomyces euteiches]|uniref:Capsule synthesis protein CapA domain-containing protein n=1 Tax=Aphanomyces euteiches TaxID=100861 RepID=A0A6G0XAV7_9STRA|nr:hypothetical protein Ae201684_006468 [Aphanomyces euteiches]KAH9090829.1 hypothetical protein Ae201684P_006233 [Aphanomyces euteiches]KAH9133504.1 hypothetical protein AeRB84_020407 [Aphanomyces euteiches]